MTSFLRRVGGSKGAIDGLDEPVYMPTGDIVRQGLMCKQGGSFKSWKERWFILTKDALSYYKGQGEKEPIDALQLEKIQVCQREATDVRNPNRFPFYFSVDVGTRVYVIGARTETERNEWVDDINALIQQRNKFGAPEVPPKGGDLRFSNDNLAGETEGSVASSTGFEAKSPAPLPLTSASGSNGSASAIPTAGVAQLKTRPLLTGTVHKQSFDLAEYVKALRSLVRAETYSDVIFTIGNERFHAHRAIVAARAPALAQLIDTKQARPVVAVPQVSADVFGHVLKYIYTEEITVTAENAVDLVAAANQFHLTRLADVASVFVRDNVTVDNVLPMLQAANRLKATNLEKFLFKFFQTPDRYNEVIRQPEISEIAMENKALYVAISQVLAQPADKYNADLSQVTVGEPTLIADITSLFANGLHADLRVVGKDGELVAHKAIIAARSPPFIEEGLLTADEEGRQGRVLKFPNVEINVLHAFVQALYTNELAIDHADTSFGLMELADRVRQETIVSVCEDLFSKNLTHETALRTLMIASEYELVALKKETLQLLIREGSAILTRRNLRPVLEKWPWCLVDIIRALVRGNGNELTDDEERGRAPVSDDDDDD